MMYDPTFIDAIATYSTFEPSAPLHKAEPSTATDAAPKKQQDRLMAIAATVILSLFSGAVVTTLFLGPNQAAANLPQPPTQALTQQQMQQWVADKAF